MTPDQVQLVQQSFSKVAPIADQAGNGLYNPATPLQQTLVVNKADATVSVTPYSVTYNGQAYTATVASIFA